MLRLPFMRSFVATLAAAAALSLSAPALASECELSIADTVGLGFLMPFPECPVTLHGDVGFGLGNAFFTDDRPVAEERLDVRLFAEAGVLVRAGDEEGAERVDVGPVAMIAGLGYSATDHPFEAETLQLGLMGKVRWWAPGDLVTFDGGVGPLLNRYSDDRLRLGLLSELGMTLHGLAGAYVTYTHAYGSREHTVYATIKITYGAAVFAACAMAAGSKC